MKIGAIILSGGKSSRMGTNKALLTINEKTNIERITNQLKERFQDIILVTNEPDVYSFLNIKVTTDRYPGKGPLAGLHAGLLASENDVNLIVACDMPFVSSEFAEHLVKEIGEYDAVVSVINGKQHPLFSVFKRNVVRKIEECLKTDRLRMKDLLNEMNVYYMTEGNFQNYSTEKLERIFFNMNSPTEYEEAKKWALTDDLEWV